MQNDFVLQNLKMKANDLTERITKIGNSFDKDMDGKFKEMEEDLASIERKPVEEEIDLALEELERESKELTLKLLVETE